jgi:hypothetical protein
MNQIQPKYIKDIQLGDNLLTDNGFSKVVLIPHRDPDQPANYLVIQTNTDKTIKISANHMISVNKTFKNASEVKLGDSLYTYNGNQETVSSVTTETIKGVYAPFTENGTLVVDGIVASCYAEVNNHNKAHRICQKTIRWLSEDKKREISQIGPIHPMMSCLSLIQKGVMPFVTDSVKPIIPIINHERIRV